jgi:hypothetical protein
MRERLHVSRDLCIKTYRLANSDTPRICSVSQVIRWSLTLRENLRVHLVEVLMNARTAGQHGREVNDSPVGAMLVWPLEGLIRVLYRRIWKRLVLGYLLISPGLR